MFKNKSALYQYIVELKQTNTAKETVSILNRKGYKTAQGKQWNIANVNNIMYNNKDIKQVGITKVKKHFRSIPKRSNDNFLVTLMNMRVLSDSQKLAMVAAYIQG